MARNLAKRRGARGARAPTRTVRGAGAVDARHGVRAVRALRRRRLQPVPEEGRSLQRAHARCQPAPARGLRRAPARDRRARQDMVAALQARGFKSPYLRNYVVARINPVRFHKAKKGDDAPRHAARPGADAHGGRGTRVQSRRGVQLRSRLGGGGRGLGPIAEAEAGGKQRGLRRAPVAASAARETAGGRGSRSCTWRRAAAKQHVGHAAALRTGEPRGHEAVGRGELGIDPQRPAGEKHADHGDVAAHAAGAAARDRACPPGCIRAWRCRRHLPHTGARRTPLSRRRGGA